VFVFAQEFRISILKCLHGVVVLSSMERHI